jgi:hypothetical protein
MTTVNIQLPDQLAQDAERAGLLSPAALEELLRKQLRAQSAAALIAALREMDSSDDSEAITPEVASEEIALMRAERRAASKA